MSEIAQEWSDSQYDDFVKTSYDYLNGVQSAAKRNFSLGSYERFDWDQEAGRLEFSDEGVAKVVAQVQFVGSISTVTNTWLWSWANDSVLEHLKTEMQKVKDFGERHNLDELINPYWKATEEDGWAMTAVAANLLLAKGAYRSPAGNGFTFMVFTEISWVNGGNN